MGGREPCSELKFCPLPTENCPMPAKSLIARWLEPLVSGLWIFFLVWTAWIAAVWTFAIGDSVVAGWTGNRDLRAVLGWLIASGDVAWIILAAANVHLWLAETEGLRTARRWALIVGGGGAALAVANTLGGFPLGPIEYSRQLGMKFGPVPVGLPLLWFALVIGARQTVLRCWAGVTHGQLAVATAALVLLTAAQLEPVAAKVRAWWFWRPIDPSQPPQFSPPWTNYAAWFLTALVLTYFLREDRVATRQRTTTPRPAIIFLLLNAVLLATHLGRHWRG